MSKEALAIIGQQAIEIANLKEEARDLRERINKACLRMICIGGPLNDNVLQFNKDQLRLIHNIYNELEG